MSDEVPWFTEPPPARLDWSSNTLGHLHFYDPHGERAAVPVTRGPSYERPSNNGLWGSPVWHIDEDGEIVTVSPSVHFVGHWHSPNPVQFRLVEELDDPKR